MKKVVTILIIFFTAISAQNCIAQEQTEDVVYLKSGSIIRGEILEQIPNKTVKIKLQGGSVLVYDYGDVTKIEKASKIAPESTIYGRKGKKLLKNHVINNTGYMFSLGMGFNAGGLSIDRWGSAAFSINIVNGWKFNQYLQVGIGIDIDAHTLHHLTFFPVYGHISGNFLNNKFTPYYKLDVGYAPVISNQGTFSEGTITNATSKHYVSPGIGYRFYTKNKVNFFIETSYKFHGVEIEYIEGFNNQVIGGNNFPEPNFPNTVDNIDPNAPRIVEKGNFNNFVFKFGFAF